MRYATDIGEWFEVTYTKSLGQRSETIRTALTWCLPTPLILETGAARTPGSWKGDGQSTVVFADFVSRYGGLLISCDTEPAAIRSAQQSLKERGLFSAQTLFFCAYSIEILRQLRCPTALLYMDAVDFDIRDPDASQIHHLHEATAGLPLLGSGSVVLIDDCDLPQGSKGGRAVPCLMEHGFRRVLSAYQTLLVREQSL